MPVILYGRPSGDIRTEFKKRFDMWAQLLNMLLGLWLMAAPESLGYYGRAADNDRIVVPGAASFASTGLSGCTKAVSRWNIPLGAWLISAPWVLGYRDTPMLNDMVVGVLITVLSFVQRKTSRRYGGGWSTIW